MGSFDKDGVGSAIVGGNGEGFVEETMEVFETNSLVVATSSDMEFDTEDCADFLEEAFESAAIVDDDQATETDLEENILSK